MTELTAHQTEIADTAPKLFIDLSGLPVHNIYADGCEINVDAVAAAIAPVAAAATGRHVAVATDCATANLFAAGHNAHDITDWFEDEIADCVEDEAFWTTADTKETA